MTNPFLPSMPDTSGWSEKQKAEVLEAHKHTFAMLTLGANGDIDGLKVMIDELTLDELRGAMLAQTANANAFLLLLSMFTSKTPAQVLAEMGPPMMDTIESELGS